LSKSAGKIESYRAAVERLNEALNEELENDLLRAGLIQYFEFTWELAWKVMKMALEEEGLTQINAPRSVIKAAYQNGLIDDEKTWLAMLDDRNIIAHSYDQSYAEALAAHIPAHAEAFNELITKINKKEKER
jgi:nucleotidyltransferase substrate binding protein (TIGR01987 family)